MRQQSGNDQIGSRDPISKSVLSVPFLIVMLLVLALLVIRIIHFSQSWKTYNDFVQDASCYHGVSPAHFVTFDHCHTEKIFINRVNQIWARQGNSRYRTWQYSYHVIYSNGAEADLIGPIKSSSSYNDTYLINKNVSALFYLDRVIALRPEPNVELRLANHPVRQFYIDRTQLINTFELTLAFVGFIIFAYYKARLRN